MTNKAKYIVFCKEKNISLLFLQPFWWDAINAHWDVLHYVSKANNDFFMPYQVVKKQTFTLVRNAFFTPYSGIVHKQTINNSELKEAISFFAKKLQKYNLVEIDFPIEFTEEIVWQNYNFAIEKCRTNVLHLEKPLSEIYTNFKDALKRQIKKAEKNLTISNCLDANTIYTFIENTYSKQGKKMPYSYAIISNLLKSCLQNNCGIVWQIQDESKNVLGILWQVWDADTSYYLVGANNKSQPNSSAIPALMWHAIQFAVQKKCLFFDFEGSNIESINTFFKQFAPTEKSYCRIQKNNSILLKALLQIKNTTKKR